MLDAHEANSWAFSLLAQVPATGDDGASYRSLLACVVADDSRMDRSAFLNELDGFETNTGVVVLATTNHPERLDPAILNRPSRFDRKYYFNLPAAAERSAYIAVWNKQLRPELRLSDDGATHIVQQTEGFSFAYLKELFLSSMMQWIATDGSVLMDQVISDQVVQLLEQMTAGEKPVSEGQ